MKNIILIGMMGCGKTTCGNELARRLNRKLVDTDALIIGREKRSISDIFASEGEEYFRNLETALCHELSAEEGLIIATGGGLPLREENTDLLRRSGIVVWLKRDPAATFISESMDGRPLAQNGIADFVRRFNDRAQKYAAASHIVIDDFSDIDTTVELILNALRNQNAL